MSVLLISVIQGATKRFTSSILYSSFVHAPTMIILIGLPKETSLIPVYCIKYYEDLKRTIEEELFQNHTVYF